MNIRRMMKWMGLLALAWSVTGCQTPHAPNDTMNVRTTMKQASPHLLEAPQKADKPASQTAPKMVLPKLNLQQMVGKDLVLNRRFSVAVRNVPVRNFLYSLAKDARIALDLRDVPPVKITLVMKKAPLKAILDRVSQQAGLYYAFKDGVLKVERDRPVWRNYYVDYVNVDKKSKGMVNLNMSVGGSVGGQSSSGTTGSNVTSVEVSSEQSFWKELETGLEVLLGLSDKKGGKAAGQKGSIGAARSTSISGTRNQTGQQGQMAGENSLPANRILINREAGMISVYAPRRLQQVVRDYVKEVLRRAKRQVLIEATVVEVILSDNYRAGIDWANWSLNNGNIRSENKDGLIKIFASENSSYSFSLDFGLDFLQKFGKTKVLSTPKIMAINNQTAILKVVDNQVYFTTEVNTSTSNSSTTVTFETELHTVPVGFMMTLTPFVNDDDEVTLYIRPTLSRIVDYVNDPHPELKRAGVESRIPVVQEREVSSLLKLRNGQVAIIGGLMQDEMINRDDSLPGVGSLQGVGHLFTHNDRNKRKTELVIFIRPIIMDDGEEADQVQSVRQRLKSLLR